ncbi:MAG: elongation factor P maturation arginine rhamnosyltransferase EarP [Leptothrix sp. (in: b-proteobacteria)]
MSQIEPAQAGVHAAPQPSATLATDRAGPWRWDIFCRVIDNHGDLGVCWRLARELAGRGHTVRLWVDDPAALAWMAPAGCAGVEVLAWRDGEVERLVAALPDQPLPAVGDVVVEAFGCDPPDAFLARMAARQPAPVWLNLEYLSAEDYVERSHQLASPQWRGPAAGLTKWFFYPGFTPATGGLLREPGLLAEQAAFGALDGDLGGGLGEDLRLTQEGLPGERRALLFCYDNPALPAWLAGLAQGPDRWRVLLTPGFATRQAQAWGAARPDSGLALHPLPYVSQPEFDRLLWRADLNLVRGEDSLVRAIWAGRPFVWQIYPQLDGAHADKLAAFLDLYLAGADATLARRLRQVFEAWNSLGGWDADTGRAAWRQVLGPLWPAWRSWAAQRCQAWSQAASLVEQLLKFVAARRAG